MVSKKNLFNLFSTNSWKLVKGMQKHRFLTISETHYKNLLLLEKETKKD